MNLYAMLYQLSDGTLEHSDRCKSVECAVKLINPLTDGGKTLLGHSVLYSEPTTALMWLHRRSNELESILAAPQAAPAGMVLVPRHPKSDVIGAMQRAHSVYAPGSKMERAYAAMCEHFAAAPAAQSEDWFGDVLGSIGTVTPLGAPAAQVGVRIAHKGPEDFPKHQCPAESAAVWNVCCMEHADLAAGRPLALASTKVEPIPAAPAVVVDEAMEMLRRYSAHLRSQAESEIDDECHAELLAEADRADKAIAAALNQGKANG